MHSECLKLGMPMQMLGKNIPCTLQLKLFTQFTQTNHTKNPAKYKIGHQSSVNLKGMLSLVPHQCPPNFRSKHLSISPMVDLAVLKREGQIQLLLKRPNMDHSGSLARCISLAAQMHKLTQGLGPKWLHENLCERQASRCTLTSCQRKA